VAEHSTDRLVRMLGLVAYLDRKESVPVPELARHFGVSQQQIIKDVELLWVSGTPGYAPDDLIDFDYDQFERGVISVTADRGMAGAYSATAIREAEKLIEQLTEQGREIDLYALGRRAVSYYNFRGRTIKQAWTGSSDAPSSETAQEVADTLLKTFLAPAEEGGVKELHVVFTQFKNMVSQTPRVIRMLPIEVVEAEVATPAEDLAPLYDFEPNAETVLDALLPRYVSSRIYSFLLQSAASELAARQRAMHTATENAEELIRMYTRLANQARQAEITQEISEIVSGADALASA